jgi:hypothetical protein
VPATAGCNLQRANATGSLYIHSFVLLSTLPD